MNTIENNKLIAEFLGAYIAKSGQRAHDIDNKFPNGNDRLTPEKMLYHKSWDWLMPVVQLIKERQLFGSQNLIDDIDNVLTCNCEIEELYEAVVEFIKWYNENK
jgi:hypothetical protein